MKTLSARIQYLGGSQIDRINKQKLESFRWALKNDYNRRMIKTATKGSWPCLINKNNLKADYDKEYLSIEFESGLQAGDTFECLDDGTHWMVYLPIITETAYLRSEIIRCRYTMDVNGKEYWVYFQGPTETDLRWFIKSGINVNELNLSGTIYIKNDENTKKYFKRFTHIKMDGHVWEVQVTDSISVPGIIELEVQEYYDNSIEELPSVVRQDDADDGIIGKTVVKQDVSVGYSISAELYDEKAKWSVSGDDRVSVDDVMENGRVCVVSVHQGAVKPFKVNYGAYSLDVTIDWAKPKIQGPQEVYPYDTHDYWIKNCDDDVEFSIDNDLARIVSSSGSKCTVDILSSKRGSFVVSAAIGDDTYELPVKILSL